MQHLDSAAHVEADLEDLQHAEIQVGPYVEAVVSEILGRVRILCGKQALVADIVQIDIVPCAPGTAVEDHVHVGECTIIPHRLVIPVDIDAGAVHVGGELLLRIDRSPSHAVVVGDGLVVEAGVFERAERLVQALWSLDPVSYAGLDRSLAFDAPAGSYADDSVGSLLSVEGKGGGILQYLNLLDFGRRDGAYILGVHLESVHEELGHGP